MQPKQTLGGRSAVVDPQKGSMDLNLENSVTAMPAYEYAGARSLVLLHEQELNNFLQTWFRAKATAVTLPETDDPAYVSLDALLAHVFFSARRYMVWMCEALEISDPEIRHAPSVLEVEGKADEYMAHLVKQWQVPLSHIEEERFYGPEYLAPWNVRYCIDPMLEHAVMHPFRHAFQLENLQRNHKGL